MGIAAMLVLVAIGIGVAAAVVYGAFTAMSAQTSTTGYRGGQTAPPGHYWKLSTGELVVVQKGGETLPGTITQRYLRTPAFMVLFIGPLVGALYVLVLPFLGFAILGQALARGMGNVLIKLGVAQALAQFMSGVRWLPGRAYLLDWAARQKSRAAPPARTPRKTRLDNLQEEVKERREKGEK